MSGRGKMWVGVGVTALLAVMVVLALRRDGGPAVEVRVEEVGRHDLVAKVVATGHIEPKASVDISADVSGRVVRLPVEEGQDVREGDLLLVIDPTQFQAAMERARGGLSQTRAQEAQARFNFVQAERDARRLTTLKERTPELVTDQEVETAVTQADVNRALWQAAEHAVEQAAAALREAEDRLSKTTIRAPMDGRITRLNVERGETAIVGTMNNPGSLLLTIADLSVMEAVIEVDETDVPDISVGDSASVEIDAFPGRRFAGVVTKIGNSSIRPRSSMQASGSGNQAIDFEVRITLDDPPATIRPDLSATSDIVTAVRPAALAIPITALALMSADQVERIATEAVPDTAHPMALDGDAEGVFVVDGEIVRFRPVQVGVAGENYFEVLAGLEEGERVVSGTYQAIRELRDGSRIKVTRVDTVGAVSARAAGND